MFQPRGEHSDLVASIWLVIQPVFLDFQLSSPSFPTTFQMQLGLPHPLIANNLRCMCTHPINATGVHLLHCAHSIEHTSTHDVIRDTFVNLDTRIELEMVNIKGVKLYPLHNVFKNFNCSITRVCKPIYPHCLENPARL
jgi:hypothetical protein